MARATGTEERTKRDAGRWRLLCFRIAAVLFAGAFPVGLFPALEGIVPDGLPDEVFLRVKRPDPPMTSLALIGAVPWIVYAVEQGSQGRLAPEWDAAHYGFVASLAVVVVLWSLLGAVDQRGWLWPATGAGIGRPREDGVVSLAESR